jgi:hypothetical protein
VLRDICSHVTVFSGSGSWDMLAACTWVWPGRERGREERGKLTQGSVPRAYQYLLKLCLCEYFNSSKGKVNNGLWVLLLATRGCHDVTEVTYIHHAWNCQLVSAITQLPVTRLTTWQRGGHGWVT